MHLVGSYTDSKNTSAVRITVKEVILIVVLYCGCEVKCVKLPIRIQKDTVFKYDGRDFGIGMPLSVYITQIA